MMGLTINNCLLALVLITASQCLAEEGSLRSAMNAMSKRQHDLGDYSKYSDDFYTDGDRYGYPADNSNELAFLNLAEKNQELKDPMYEYDESENSNKRISSSFRERIEEDKSRQKEKFENMLMNDLNDIRSSSENSEYMEFLHELWQKYGRTYPDILNYYTGGRPKGEIRKRSHPHHYTGLGLDSVGMKKRSYKPSEAVLYISNKDAQNDYGVSKRFPVTKRSSNYYPIPYTNEFSRHVKRSSKKDVPTKTDPKVAEDLSTIFSPTPKNHQEPKSDAPEKPVSKPKKTEHAVDTETKKPQVTTSMTTQRPEKKDILQEIAIDAAKEKPIQVKKKSIDWSDYFGIDRRKKSDNLDNEWLMERYHKAVAMATKRDSEAVQDTEKTKNHKTTEDKINDMDAKFKNIEYAIVDDALKYTGAHEGAVDSQEIQEVKDRLISQLAAAYSLEKMRRALGEYRRSIQKEKFHAKETKDDDDKIDEKRIAVPRKSAEMDKDDEDEDEDNNIKCSQDDANCNKDTYGEIVDRPNFGYCPKIQRVCADVAAAVGGQHALALEPACSVHQMCLLCGDNTWFSPTRQCNILFLTKADYICQDNMACREVARRSVRYLLEVNRLLKSEPMDNCDLAC